jgi:hypothetical protein
MLQKVLEHESELVVLIPHGSRSQQGTACADPCR